MCSPVLERVEKQYWNTEAFHFQEGLTIHVLSEMLPLTNGIRIIYSIYVEDTIYMLFKVNLHQLLIKLITVKTNHT